MALQHSSAAPGARPEEPTGRFIYESSFTKMTGTAYKVNIISLCIMQGFLGPLTIVVSACLHKESWFQVAWNIKISKKEAFLIVEQNKPESIRVTFIHL